MSDQDMKINFENMIRIGIALSSEHNIDTLLEMIFREAQRLTLADGATIYTVSKDQKFLEWKMHHNETFGTHEGGFSASPPPLPPLPLFIEGEPNLANVPAYVASTGKAINIPNIYESEEFDFSGPRQYDSKTGYRAESMLGVPMLDHNDNAIGVLQLVNAKNPE
ncbi:MAG: GAF domain-containing protein, partial [Candidatus Latescibacteria bacterium]|nr:GAF domain-containing protein [Candidatus Latescibacterota bacterium]